MEKIGKVIWAMSPAIKFYKSKDKIFIDVKTCMLQKDESGLLSALL